MGCTNCFSGCVETTSDKCVKYTGNDIDFLNIHTGDPLESIEQSITDYLATVFSGVGIFPIIDPTLMCTMVSQYFPPNTDPTLLDILSAIVRAICDLEATIIVQKERIDSIEEAYTVGCLTADPNAGTHVILQAAITSLCTAIGDITVLQNLFATCITTNNIGSYIQNYINAQVDNNMYTKMVPYVIYPFYPSPTIMSGAFGSTGEGLGIWQKVFLCNGNNGTPDLRGRSLIGTTNMQGGAFNPNVDPGTGNPAYDVGTLNGQNNVVLGPSQIPAHTHTADTVVTNPSGNIELTIGVSTVDYAPSFSGRFPITSINGVGSTLVDFDPLTAVIPVATETGFTVSVTNENTGGGAPHTNVHPVIGCHYIMYVP
jgi:microcystin-dependent protein